MSANLYGEKGFIPFHRIRSPARTRSTILRWRWGPCLVMSGVAFALATLCFETFGWSIAGGSPRRPPVDPNAPVIFDGWDRLERMFIL